MQYDCNLASARLGASPGVRHDTSFRMGLIVRSDQAGVELVNKDIRRVNADRPVPFAVR